MAAPIAPNTLGFNVFTAPGKPMIGERAKPFGDPLGFDPITSTLIFGEYDAVLVDAQTTVAEAEALADWIALHHRNLQAAIRKNEPLNCDVMMGYYGVTASEMMVHSYRKRQYVAWDQTKERIIRA